VISVAQLRVEIQDRLKYNTPDGVAPEMLGISDGVRTVYSLKYFNAVPSSVDVQIGAVPTSPGIITYVSYPSDSGANWIAGVDANGFPIVTLMAPQAAGNVVSARYLVSRFSDAELQSYISQNTVPGDDSRVLIALHAAIIPADISDPQRMEVRKIGDTSFDSSSYQRTQLMLRQQLLAQLEKNPEASGPSFGITRF
jgi:hypothetical protein